MDKMEVLSGTLDLLVLRVLSSGALHGFGVAERIHVLSREMLSVEEGSLYPSLYRMEAKGWLKSQWAITDTGRRARFYRLTPAGRSQLAAEQQSWARLTNAVQSVLSS